MRVLVTGAGGFIGGALARRLVKDGHQVRSYSRGHYSELEALGIEHQRGDIADGEKVHEACQGVETVFHAAAIAAIWGRRSLFESTNVDGTRNVVEGCLKAGVPRLVLTSSPSVVFDGSDEAGIDESAPYPRRFLNDYSRTKAIAEQLALDASCERLAVTALRPHLVWGPGDRHLVPRLIERARRGQLKLIGGGPYLIDSTYIDNAVDAHILAAQKLAPTSRIAGRPFFISNGEPRPISGLINDLIGCADLSPVEATVPRWLARATGATLEGLYSLLQIESEPRLTRFLARQLSTHHYFDLSQAKECLDWQPKISIEEGMKLLRAHLVENPSTEAIGSGATL